MKAIIYAGIGLFSVATVYGVADYYQSKTKGTLNDLYSEEAREAATTPNPHEPVKNVMELKKETAVTNDAAAASNSNTVKKASSKTNSKRVRTLKFEDFSRGQIIPPPVIKEKTEAQRVKFTEPAKEVVPAIEERKAEAVVTLQPLRRIDLRNYSRASLKKPVKKTAKDF